MKKKLVSIILCFLIMPLFTAPVLAVQEPDNSDRLSVSEDYCLAVLKDGTLWDWGHDNGVHLGLRYSDSEVVSSPANIMDNARSVFAGWGTAMVIKNDNTLWAWGDNMPGAGEDRLTYALKPEKVMDNVISAAGGHWFAVAVKSDGSLWGWGNNRDVRMDNSRKITDGDNNILYLPVLQPIKLMDGVKKTVADGNFFCALKSDGTLLLGGSRDIGSKAQINGLEYRILAAGVKDVTMTADVICYIKNDDSLWSISRGYTSPVKIMEGVKAVSVSGLPLLILKKDGQLLARDTAGVIDSFFGTGPDLENMDWQNVDWDAYEKPKSLPLMEDVRTISAGPSQYLIEKNDGTIWTWGFNTEGGIGDGQLSTNTMGSSNFIKLEFSTGQGQLFTEGAQKSKLLSQWLAEKTADGSIPSYDAGFKADWPGAWGHNISDYMDLRYAADGKTVYGYDFMGSFFLKGTANGNKLKGHISNGVFELTMLPGGRSFTGLYFENSAAEPIEWTDTKN